MVRARTRLTGAADPEGEGGTDALRLRLALTLLGIGVALFGLRRFSGDGLDREGIFFFISLLVVPYAMYLLLLRTPDASLWTGALLIGVTLVVQIMVSSAWDNGSSTAPMGYLWLPFAGVFVVGAAAVMDRYRA